MNNEKLIAAVYRFTGNARVVMCEHDHKLQGTGGVFYQSVGLLQCSICYGWQPIRKAIA